MCSPQALNGAFAIFDDTNLLGFEIPGVHILRSVVGGHTDSITEVSTCVVTKLRLYISIEKKNKNIY